MMADIINFVPKRNAEATKNLQEFVSMCRWQLTVFGADLDFDANNWDVREQIELKGKGGVRCSMQFSNYDASKQTKGNWVAMCEPFLSFAKSYMRYMHAMRPTKIFANRIVALRALERALTEKGQSPTIVEADLKTFTRAANLIGEKLGASAYRVGKELETIAEFCTDYYLTNSPVLWKSHLRRPQDKNRTGADAEKDREERKPSEAALESLPKAFLIASETPDVIITSAAAILCSCPDRVNELLSLPVDCEVEKEHNGKTVYGLRWWPAKGAEPMIKWIIPGMVDVVKKAIKRLRECTAEARRIAAWYEMHPDQIYLSAGLESLRGQKKLSGQEIASILGISQNST